MNLRLALFTTVLVASFAIILPWAANFKSHVHEPAGFFYTLGMGIFAGILVLGFVWAVRKGFFN